MSEQIISVLNTNLNKDYVILSIRPKYDKIMDFTLKKYEVDQLIRDLKIASKNKFGE